LFGRRVYGGDEGFTKQFVGIGTDNEVGVEEVYEPERDGAKNLERDSGEYRVGIGEELLKAHAVESERTGGDLHGIGIDMRYLLVAFGACILTVGGLRLMGWAAIPETVKLENPKVRVKEVVYQPGVARERYIRPTDQIIVFLDDSKYERIDSTTKERTVRERKGGDVIWHDKGEDAPVLKNLGTKPYRALVIELKK